MKNKKILALIIATLIATFSLTGCSVVEWLLEEETTGVSVDGNSPANGEYEKLERTDDDFTQDEGEVENLTTVIEGRYNGLEVFEPQGELDENPNKTITRSTTSIPQIRGTDIYGNTLGDEFYMYRNLLSSVEKKAYDQIYLAVIQCIDTIDVAVGLNNTQFQNVFYSVQYDHPEIFWLTGTYHYYYNNQGLLTSVTFEFNDLVHDIRQNYANFHAAALGIALTASNLPNEVEQVKYVNDHITNVTQYVAGSPYNQTAYSTFVNAQTVCAGYAKAFQYCMQLLSIPSTFVVGFAGERHGWNIVELDGEYYNVDVTWNDPSSNDPSYYDYSYFNITDSQISADHQRIESSVYLPAANGTKYSYNNYFNGNAYGSDFSNYSAYTQPVPFIGDLVAQSLNSNQVVETTATTVQTTTQEEENDWFDDDDSDETQVTTTADDDGGNWYDDWDTDSDDDTSETTTATTTYDDSDNNSDDDFNWDDYFEDDTYIDDDDFDWESYYNSFFDIDTDDNIVSDDDSDNDYDYLTDGFYDEESGIYYMYDWEYGVYYYYEESDGYYYGFDENDWSVWFVWLGDGWYYL